MTRPRTAARLVGANIGHAGRHNQRVVLHAIRVNGRVTRAELAEVTGLTHATVTNITNRLLDAGLLQRAGQRRGGRGQPATRLTINPAGAFSIGINIDRDHLTMVGVDFGGAVRARIGREMAFPTPRDVSAFYQQAVDDLLAEAGFAREAVMGVGVAMPDDLGAVDLPGRPVDHASWATVDLEALFQQPFATPIFSENDAAAAAIGEMQFGLGQQHTSFFYLLITVGLGGGVVVNSLYDRGANGRSGEIGFMHVDDGRGSVVQLQTLVSLAGLGKAFREAGLATAGVTPPDLSAPTEAAVIDQWIERAAGALAQPLIAVNCLLNPDAILIGGRLPVALMARLAARADALARAAGGHVPTLAPVRTAALAEDAAAVGAALLPFGDLLLPADGGGAGAALASSAATETFTS